MERGISMKFIEVKDVDDKTHIVFIDKIICIGEGQHLEYFNNGRCEGYDGYAATHIICEDNIDITTYESTETIKKKLLEGDTV